MKNSLKSNNTSQSASWRSTPRAAVRQLADFGDARPRWRKRDKLALFIILILGALLRFYGLNWDQGHHLHPDERMIVMVAERIHFPQTQQEWQNLLTPQSPLNPKFFAYGSLPIYLLKFTGRVFSFFSPKWASYSHINLLGRAISAVADLGVIVLIILAAKRVWSKNIGLLAALLYGLAVFPIQAAHFYAVDSLLNFFILATLYRLILLYDRPAIKNASWVGIFFGLSLATKVSATVLVVAIGITLCADLFLISLKRIRQIKIVPKIHQESFNFILWIFSAFRTPKRERLIGLLFTVFKYGGLTMIAAATTFIIFQPYALIDFKTFWRQTLEQHQMTKNAYIFPYTLQYVGSTPYLYHLKNWVLWGMGIPLGILSLAATIKLFSFLVAQIPRAGKENQEAKILILVFFFLAYFLVVGRFAIKFMRYLLPLYPLLCLFTAWFWYQCINKSNSKIVQAVQIVLIVLLLIWPLSFISIYSKPNTRVTASQWFDQNVSPGAKIAMEHWDDQVPMWGNYQFLEMPMYEPDTSELKWQKVESNLHQADYLVLASNRLYVPLQKLADCQKYERCFPKTAQYYQKLFSGELGFEKIAEFTSYPTIPFLNLKIIDDLADESFTVYDHPKVIVFKKSFLSPQF